MSVDFVLRLIDRMSTPAQQIINRLDQMQKQLDQIERATGRNGRTFGRYGDDGVRASNRITAAVEKTNASMERTHLRARRIGMALGGLLTLAPVALAGAAGRAALGGAGAREGQLLSLGTLLKTNNQMQVKAAAGWIAQFADLTPYQDNDVNAAVKQLLASKFTFSQVQGLGRITGDAASALGADPGDAAQKWEAINRAIGQIKSKGVLQGDELLQLQEAGIGTNDYLVKAFGPNYRKLQEAGKISGTAAINAIVNGLNTDYAGSMDRQSRTFLGLISTLVSRPQRIFSSLFDAGGLDDARRFMSNLVNLTDFSKPPGSRIKDSLVRGMAGLSRAIFGPLADATQGDRATQLINRLLDSLDAFGRWWSGAGPKIAAFARGVGDGLLFLWRIAEVVIKPIRMVLKAFGLLGTEGGDNLARILGYLIGGAVAFKVFGLAMGFVLGPIPAIFRLLAAVTLLNAALPMLAANGILNAVWLARLQRIMAVLTPITRVFTVLMGGWRGLLYGIGLGISGVFQAWLATNGGIAMVAANFARVFGVIGLVIGAIVALKKTGDTLMEHFQPFADFINSLKDNAVVKLLIEKPEDATGINRWLQRDWSIDARNGLNQFASGFTGQAYTPEKQLFEKGDDNFASGLVAMSKRLGFQPLDLLKVINLESGADPGAIHRNKDGKMIAAGLIQFQADAAGELGTNLNSIVGMTRAQQLPLIEKYLTMHGVKKGATLEQLYMAVLSGSANNTGPIWSANDPNTSMYYKSNEGLDTDRDGVITSKEAAEKLNDRWAKDGPTIIQHISVEAGADPKKIAQALYDGGSKLLSQYGSEIGAGRR